MTKIYCRSSVLYLVLVNIFDHAINHRHEPGLELSFIHPDVYYKNKSLFTF